MAKHYLNLNQVGDLKNLWHSGWILSDKKSDEIVLQVGPEQYFEYPPVLFAIYVTLSEGILNSTVIGNPKRVEFNKDVNLRSTNDLAEELSRTTGIKFRVEKLSLE